MTLLYNHPVRPTELQILRTLKHRMTLQGDSSNHYYTLQKGYEGEVIFHTLLQKYVASDCIILYDLLLDRNDSLFQLDCMIVQQHRIWHLEIKNLEGDFILDNNSLYRYATQKEVNNPLHQIDRGRRLLNELQKSHGYGFPIESKVIFVNPTFAIYHLHPKLPIVLPNQIHRFMNKINKTPSKLSTTHHEFAHTLFSLHTSHTLSKRLPKYEFNMLRKGIGCLNCDGFLSVESFHGMKLMCEKCGFIDSRDSAIMRCIDEFSLLFPKRKITTANIWSWSGKILSKFKIRKVLFRYLHPIGSRTDMYFVLPFRKDFEK